MGVAVLHPPRRRAGLPGRLRRAGTDDQLVARLRAGDDTAFEALYDRYHRDLLSFARHMLGTREEAEDAVQHTFLQAHRVLRADDRPVQVRAWLFAVARNRCLSVLRARRDHADVDDAAVATEGLADAVQRRADLRDLLADLQRLPEDQRGALVLAELGALDHDEIAAVLEVRPEKVKALVFQARERLMHFREGRDADCSEIREQLATLRGGALRRTPIARHLDVCPGCRDFKDEVRRQRAAMAVVLPVAPSMALKGTVLSAVFGSGGAAAAAGGAVAVAGAGAGAAATGAGPLSAAGGVLTKALVTLAVAGGAGGAGYVTVEAVRPAGHDKPSPAHRTVTPATPATPASDGTRPATPATPASPSSALTHRRGAAAPGRHKPKAATPGATRGRGHGTATAPGLAKPAGGRANGHGGQAPGRSKAQAKKAAASAKGQARRAGARGQSRRSGAKPTSTPAAQRKAQHRKAQLLAPPTGALGGSPGKPQDKPGKGKGGDDDDPALTATTP